MKYMMIAMIMTNLFIWLGMASVTVSAIIVTHNPKWAFLMLIAVFSTVYYEHKTENESKCNKEASDGI